MKYSLRSLMIVVLVLPPPLLAGAYFSLVDYRLRAIVFAIILGSGFVFAARECVRIFANANRFPKE
jgi:hypothetical protein